MKPEDIVESEAYRGGSKGEWRRVDSITEHPGAATTVELSTAQGRGVPTWVRRNNMTLRSFASWAQGPIREFRADYDVDDTVTTQWLIERLEGLKESVAAERMADFDSALRGMLQYVDAIPSDVANQFPAMPGIDRDWLDNLVRREPKILDAEKKKAFGY